MESGYKRQHSVHGKRMVRIRSGTVEPVFGNLINYYGLRKINVKGKAGAHKVMLMSAIAYNLKKLIRHLSHNRNSNLQVLTRELCTFSKMLFYDCFTLILTNHKISV